MRTVDNSENPAGEPRTLIPRWFGRQSAEPPADRFRRRLSRAGVVAALVTTAIGITLVVRADSGPPVGVNDSRAYSGHPAVQSLDGGASRSDIAAANTSTAFDASSELP